MNKVNSLKKIVQLTEDDIKVFLSLILEKEAVYSEEEILADINKSIDELIEESLYIHQICPKLRTVVDEIIEKRTQKN